MDNKQIDRGIERLKKMRDRYNIDMTLSGSNLSGPNLLQVLEAMKEPEEKKKTIQDVTLDDVIIATTMDERDRAHKRVYKRVDPIREVDVIRLVGAICLAMDELGYKKYTLKLPLTRIVDTAIKKYCDEK